MRFVPVLMCPLNVQGTIEQYLPKDKHKGTVDMTGVKLEEAELSPIDKERQELLDNKPPLSECLSLHDFETIARKVSGELPDLISLSLIKHPWLKFGWCIADHDTSSMGLLLVRS